MLAGDEGDWPEDQNNPAFSERSERSLERRKSAPTDKAQARLKKIQTANSFVKEADAAVALHASRLPLLGLVLAIWAFVAFRGGS